MNNFKHIILNGQTVRAFKEAKRLRSIFELNREYERYLQEFNGTGIEIEFYPSEEEKLRKYFTINLLKGLVSETDIADFCEIKERDCVGDKCDNLNCINVCQKPKLYAFFKAPGEETGIYYQPLFNYMHEAHGLILLQTEMDEIINIVNKLK